MCGIAGVQGEAAGKQSVLNMLEPIMHRGRDDQGTFVDTGVGLGCNRLAIIDVQGGHQPVSNEEGTVWVVLNGEIYNHDELREKLKQLGHTFKSRSDTEVIAQSFEEWGPRCFGQLNGMFAVAVWDASHHTLHLSRDRVGIKPLYYAVVDGNVLFGSEVKALLGARLLENLSVNRRMVDQLLEVGYPLEAESLLNQVHQIPPGHHAAVKEGRINVSHYWQPPSIQNGPPNINAILKTVRESVIHQTITSDVPVGAFLSGGLDTSTVVAFASRARPDGLKTFCMGFNEPTDEFADARIVAETFGTDHQEILVDASDAMSIFPRMVWHSELPKVNLYSWFVNEAASKHVKVCLSGLGGDELFAGYPDTNRFRHARKIATYRKVGPLLTLASFLPGRYGKLARSLSSESLAYSSLITGFPSNEVSQSVKELVRPYFDQERGDFEQEMVRAELSTKLPYDYLLVEDAMSMAHTLEVRVPFLDNMLLDLMLPLPYKFNVNGVEGKQLLRAAVKDILPSRCMSKAKWGFSVDVFSWWKRSVREFAIKHIPESKFLQETCPKWHEKIMRKIMSTPDPKESRWYSMAWIMLGFDTWAEMFLNGEDPSSVSW